MDGGPDHSKVDPYRTKSPSVPGGGNSKAKKSSNNRCECLLQCFMITVNQFHVAVIINCLQFQFRFFIRQPMMAHKIKGCFRKLNKFFTRSRLDYMFMVPPHYWKLHLPKMLLTHQFHSTNKFFRTIKEGYCLRWRKSPDRKK